MKFWILVIAAVALLVWSLVREGFDTYTDALADVGQTPGYNPPPVCPVGTIMREDDGMCVSQSANADLQCPSGYKLRDDKKCQRINGTEVTDPTCPAGFGFNSTAMKCDTHPVEPTCPGDYTYKGGKCEKKTSTPPTTTGGSSTSTYGPTTGGPTNRIRQVFGPQFTGSDGDLTSQNTGDSSQTNVYPELLGGIVDTSSRIPGAGITAPSKNWTLSNNGSLPPKNTMGSDEMSRYFPYSRTPGDMDVIPDPYRVAQTFSASSYASKTEPVPFLTDFSAFQK